MSEAHIVTYHPSYRDAFVALNRQWIETYFAVEPMDLSQLEQAEDVILKAGGEIFFVIEAGQAVGTCAMIPHGSDFELAKMAVDPAFRGRGFGDLLMTAAIAWARARGLERITLLSNRILEPAIALYRKHGFRTVRVGPHPDYKRCDIEMELSLRESSAVL